MHDFWFYIMLLSTAIKIPTVAKELASLSSCVAALSSAPEDLLLKSRGGIGAFVPLSLIWLQPLGCYDEGVLVHEILGLGLCLLGLVWTDDHLIIIEFE